MPSRKKDEKKFKKCIFPFIMTILTFIIGCSFVCLCKYSPLNLKIKISLIGYLPTLIYLILLLICYFKCNTKKSQIVITILSIILTFFLLFYYFMAIFFYVISDNPVTDVKYYQNAVNGKLLKVFPAEIPDDVKKVKFYYEPGFLQGGTIYSLYYIDKNMTEDKFDKKYRNKAIWIGHKKEYTEEKGLLTDAFSYTPSYFKNENEYLIYLIESKCDNSGYCNHGKFLLAAYNEKTNEVVFQSEQW